MNLSHRASLILMLVLGLAMLRMWSSGKLTRAWKAVNGNPPSGGSGGSGGVGGGLSGGASAGAGSANQTFYNTEQAGGGPFGLRDITFSHIAPSQYWQGASAPDRGLIASETGEWNYGLPFGAHEPIFLPSGGAGWSLERQGTQSGLGGYEIWKNLVNGAELAFLHLSSLWDPTAGTGGVVGTTGWPTDPAYGAGVAGPSNAHLAVIYNQAGQQYIS